MIEKVYIKQKKRQNAAYKLKSDYTICGKKLFQKLQSKPSFERFATLWPEVTQCSAALAPHKLPTLDHRAIPDEPDAIDAERLFKLSLPLLQCPISGRGHCP